MEWREPSRVISEVYRNGGRVARGFVPKGASSQRGRAGLRPSACRSARPLWVLRFRGVGDGGLCEQEKGRIYLRFGNKLADWVHWMARAAASGLVGSGGLDERDSSTERDAAQDRPVPVASRCRSAKTAQLAGLRVVRRRGARRGRDPLRRTCGDGILLRREGVVDVPVDFLATRKAYQESPMDTSMSAVFSIVTAVLICVTRVLMSLVSVFCWRGVSGRTPDRPLTTAYARGATRVPERPQIRQKARQMGA